MKITKQQLKRIIKEELTAVLEVDREGHTTDKDPSWSEKDRKILLSKFHPEGWPPPGVPHAADLVGMQSDIPGELDVDRWVVRYKMTDPDTKNVLATAPDPDPILAKQAALKAFPEEVDYINSDWDRIWAE